MVLRQIGTFDRGYIPPYALFVAVTALSGGAAGRDAEGDGGEDGI